MFINIGGMFILEKEKMTDEEKAQRTKYTKAFGLSKKQYKLLIQCGFSFITISEKQPLQFGDDRIIRTGDVLSVDVSVPVLRLMRALQK